MGKVLRDVLTGIALLSFPLNAQWYPCTGSGALTCTSSKVGIGTSNPGAGSAVSLDVADGDVRAVGPLTCFIVQAPDAWAGGWASRGLTFTNSNNTVLAQFGARGTGAPSTLVYAYIGSSWESPWMLFKPDGKIGIGVPGASGPATALDLGGGTNYTNAIPAYQFFSNNAKILQVANSGQSVLNLVSGVNANNGVIGALSFSRSLGQGDAHQNVAGITATQRGTTTASAGGELQFWTKQDGTAVSGPRLVITHAGNVGIGIADPSSKLAVNGKISASEVVVTSAPADYVFDESYPLRPLSEVASYVKASHHLPGIPSGPEVQANGIEVGEMQSRLLAKIEELTLYMISADQKNKELEARLALLERTPKP